MTSVGLAASSAPLDEVPGEWDALSVDARELTRLLRRDPSAAFAGIVERCQWFATDPEAIFEPEPSSAVGDGVDPDDHLVSEPEVLEPLLVWMREGARQGAAGYVEDWIADALPWGFSASDVNHDVHIWWGDGDRVVARSCAEYFARVIKRSTLTVLTGEGHLFPIEHWEEILAGLR